MLAEHESGSKSKQHELTKTRAVSSLQPSEVCILTAYSSNYVPGYIAAAVNRKYAEAHGYAWQCDVLSQEEMVDEIRPRTHCSWYKVVMLNRLLRAGRFKWLVWIDADAVVV